MPVVSITCGLNTIYILDKWLGVYKPTPGSRYMGGHAVKAVGWGTENGVDYW